MNEGTSPTPDSPYGTNPEDRRRTVRFPFAARIRHALLEEISSRLSACENLSCHGLAFLSDREYAIDTVLKLQIHASSTSEAVWIPLEAVVRWNRPDTASPPRFHVGAEFLDKESQEIRKLIQFAITDLDRQIAADPRNLWLLRFRGDAKYALGDTTGGQADYTQAEKIKLSNQHPGRPS